LFITISGKGEKPQRWQPDNMLFFTYLSSDQQPVPGTHFQTGSRQNPEVAILEGQWRDGIQTGSPPDFASSAPGTVSPSCWQRWCKRSRGWHRGMQHKHVEASLVTGAPWFQH